ncbi:HPr family phosphocarrier protein [Actinospica durhamensis]|uniref:Phosphocarrier protein HPr n=1 Tax=Actinospica durhamensis TaxID=1508375 RepID=A0A941ESV4_9ACTN|nr:HPr family phosphocarrier protein [Actinospica durhamensis]MBR7836573.1 HPr family phosphocarrier protein [Actinospica durhamensis]
MPQRIVNVASRVGLHARPAAVFVKAASAAALPVTIAKEGKEPVSARSILAVLGLDVRGGEEVVLEADGDGAENVLEDLARLLTEDLEG